MTINVEPNVQVVEVYKVGVQGPKGDSGSGVNALLVDYEIQGQLPDWTGSVSVSLENGNEVQPNLLGNVTALSILDWAPAGRVSKLTLYLQQGATAYSVSGWPAAIKWVGGSAPTLSNTTGEVDIIVLSSMDAGTTIIGAHVGVAS
jgi:hypothetical protein